MLPLLENSVESPQNIKNKTTIFKIRITTKKITTYNSAIPLLHIYLKKEETLIQKDLCTTVFISRLFTISKIWKQPVSLCKSMVKEDVVYTGILVGISGSRPTIK